MSKIKPLKQVHLSRLSPVMWTTQTGYPRPEISVPIPSVNGGGMGASVEEAYAGMNEYLEVPMSEYLEVPMGASVEEAYAGMNEYLEVPMSGDAVDGRYVATPMNPKASPLWSNMYRIGAAGALSRVAPFGPDAFGTSEEPSTLRKLWPFLVAFGGLALFSYFGSKRPY